MPGVLTYDALVVGAGPAGSAAAWALARAGRRVALVDRQTFPRDKVCGDALIPDALGALDAMGLRTAIDARATPLRELRLFAPSGRHVSLAGAFSCLPRQMFDALLVDAARKAGAQFYSANAVSARREQGRVAGATFTAAGAFEIAAPVTLLATGANATALAAFGLDVPRKPNAVAGRAYFRVPPDVAARMPFLAIAYERSICPGYGWIFPGPDRRFNVGVGFFSETGERVPNLHDLWARFTTRFPPAADLVRQSEPLTVFQGAPMRTGLHGARFGVPGLLVLGEAAAMTFPATGEGIGKAMESGLTAARAVLDDGPDAHVAYERDFRARFQPHYRAYRVAERWASRPALLNLLAWRAGAGGFVRAELEALIAERGDPLRLFSATGLLRSVFG